jgi:GrpB-like predicted nucleotidyltransferase (UPF0157 family)
LEAQLSLAKPIVDILVEVTSLDETKQRIVPILQAQGYDYLWRPSWGDDTPPFYAWFIKRDMNGNRTHHLHMVEAQFEHWDRLLFRDYLIEHPDVARKYGNLKKKLSGAHHSDRVAYTEAKSDFIKKVTGKAKEYCRNAQHNEPNGGTTCVAEPQCTSALHRLSRPIRTRETNMNGNGDDV